MALSSALLATFLLAVSDDSLAVPPGVPCFTQTTTSTPPLGATLPAKDGGGVYQIGTKQELSWLSWATSAYNTGTTGTGAEVSRLDALAASYEQTATIDLEDCEWLPVGEYLQDSQGNPTSNHPFTGSYDGGGFDILGLNINLPNSDNVGFFSFFQGTLISGMNIVDGVVVGEGSVGGIAGTANPPGAPGVISQSSFTGTVTASTTSSGEYVGGLVGDPNGNVAIRYSYVVATVSGYTAVGGLAGEYDGGIQDSYFRGQVTATSSDNRLGGISGTAGLIEKSFSTATVLFPNSNRGYGLAGGSSAGSSSDSFWDTQTSGIPDLNDQAGVGRTTAQMTDSTTFSGAGWGIVSGWQTFDSSASTIWGICSAVNDGYPYLLWEYTSNPCLAGSTSTSSSRAGSQDSVPGIFLSVPGLLGDQAAGSVLTFGSYAVGRNAPYLLTLEQVSGSIGQRILAQGSVNTGGHLERQVAMPGLNEGSHRLVFVSRGARGELLTLTNVIAVDSQGRFVSITPEELQPRVR